MKKINALITYGELTVTEASVLNWLLDYGSNADSVWVQDIANGLKTDIKIIQGVIGGLVKKGYIYLDKVDESDEEYIVYATESLYELNEDENNWLD